MPSKSYALTRKPEKQNKYIYFVLEEYLVTALVPSDTACLASSPGRMRRTEVWISRDEMVDFLLYAASLEASVATRSKISGTKESENAFADARRRVKWLLTVDEGVQDGHGAVGDTGVRVNLLQHCRSNRVSMLQKGKKRRVTMNEWKSRVTTHPCRCRRSMSPCEPWCASSCHRWRRSSFRHPSSPEPWKRLRGPWRRASCQRPWEPSLAIYEVVKLGRKVDGWDVRWILRPWMR